MPAAGTTWHTDNSVELPDEWNDACKKLQVMNLPFALLVRQGPCIEYAIDHPCDDSRDDPISKSPQVPHLAAGENHYISARSLFSWLWSVVFCIRSSLCLLKIVCKVVSIYKTVSKVVPSICKRCQNSLAGSSFSIASVS